MELERHLFNIAEAGLAFSELPAEEVNLTMLLDIENILDRGRLYATHEGLPLVNKKMDELRSRIRDIIDTMPVEEARDFMIERGRSAQNQFSLKEA